MDTGKTFQQYIIQQPRAEPKQPQGTQGTLTAKFAIKKATTDTDEHLVFGWASVADRADGETIIDHQGDIVEIAELENAAYDFVQFYREGSEMHERGGLDIAVLIESIVFTPEKIAALGLKEGDLPHGWWVGFRVMDDVVWGKVKDGTYTMFSVEGAAARIPA
jgi:hypothetical protein